MERDNSPGREMVDQATQELRRKIDEMLQMSTSVADPIPQEQTHTYHQSHVPGIGPFSQVTSSK